jgi:hypothetical protein
MCGLGCGLEIIKKPSPFCNFYNTNKPLILWICTTPIKVFTHQRTRQPNVRSAPARRHKLLSGTTVPEEGECESALREDFCGLAKGRRDLIVGSSFGGALKPTERASGAKLSLAQSSNIRIWKTLSRPVTASAYRSTKHAIVSANSPLRSLTLSITTSRPS